MSREASVGDVVKFIGVDGNWAFTRIFKVQANTQGLGVDAVLELIGGEKNGEVGCVDYFKIKWNGKQFIADLREEE